MKFVLRDLGLHLDGHTLNSLIHLKRFELVQNKNVCLLYISTFSIALYSVTLTWKSSSISLDVTFTMVSSIAIQICKSFLVHFVLTLIHSEIWTFTIFNLTKVGNYPLHYSMSNVTISNCLPTYICVISCRFSDIKMSNFTFQSRSRSLSAIFAIETLDSKCQNLKMYHTHFCASSFLPF